MTFLGFVVAAAPLRADEGHCARPAVAVVAPHAHGPAHAGAAFAPARASVSGDHGCPACPARSCGTMHGCSAAPQVAPEIVIAHPLALPAHRATPFHAETVPVSVTHSPPTPPPLAAPRIA